MSDEQEERRRKQLEIERKQMQIGLLCGLYFHSFPFLRDYIIVFDITRGGRDRISQQRLLRVNLSEDYPLAVASMSADSFHLVKLVEGLLEVVIVVQQFAIIFRLLHNALRQHGQAAVVGEERILQRYFPL